MKKRSILTLGLISISLLSSQFMTNNYVVNTSLKTSSNKVYLDGTAIYYNAVTGKGCTESDYNSNTKANEMGYTEGCLKWYAFGDSENTETLNILLNHNSSAANVAWNSSGNNLDGIKEAQTELENFKVGKSSTVKSTARLITATEIAKITGNESFDVTINNDWFYFETNTSTTTHIEKGENKYAWLFDYTYDCTRRGGNYDEPNTYGYWTSDIWVSNTDIGAWAVVNDGTLSGNAVNVIKNGIRPVITISKSEILEPVVKEDTENKIILEAESTNIISSSTELKVESIATDSETYTEIKKYITNIENIKVYDINLYENGSIVQPNGKVTLTFEVGNMDINKVKVYRMNDDKTYTKIDSKIVDNKIQIEVDHFSIYILTEDEITDSNVLVDTNKEANITDDNIILEEDQVENPDTGEKIIYVISMGILVILLIINIIVKLKKNKKEY